MMSAHRHPSALGSGEEGHHRVYLLQGRIGGGGGGLHGDAVAQGLHEDPHHLQGLREADPDQGLQGEAGLILPDEAGADPCLAPQGEGQGPHDRLLVAPQGPLVDPLGHLDEMAAMKKTLSPQGRPSTLQVCVHAC